MKVLVVEDEAPLASALVEALAFEGFAVDHSADGEDALHGPRSEVRLAHEFKTAILYISLDGTLSRPRLRLSSDPAVYDDAQLLGFVLGGDPDDPALADRRLDDRATGVASGLVVSQVRNRLRQVLPVDVLRVELAEDPSGSQGARFEIGKWLTDNLLIGESGHASTAWVETGFHVLLQSGDVGAVGAVPADPADKFLIGDNRGASNARATMRAYLDSGAAPITWTPNANWGATDL